MIEIIAKSKGKQRNNTSMRYTQKRKKNNSKKTVNSKPHIDIKVNNIKPPKVKTITPKKIKLRKSPNTKNKSKHTTPKKPYIRRQDQSMPVLEELLEQGYDMVTFEARPAACPICQQMNGTTWTLQEFLDTTEYSAPIFFHLHVNCLDEVRVWSSNFSLPTVYVDWQGRIR